MSYTRPSPGMEYFLPLRIYQPCVSNICQWWLRLVLLGLFSVNLHAQEVPQKTLTLIAQQPADLEDLSDFDVRRIFSGQKRQWSDGRKIKVFILPTSSSEHKEFCRTVLKVFPYQLERIWNQLLYSGQWEAPEVVPDVGTMRERVQQSHGAIGYVPVTASPSSQHKEVKS